MRKKKKVRSWEGGKVGLEVGSRNAEGGKKEGSKIFGSRKSEVGMWKAEKKEGEKLGRWEGRTGSGKLECGTRKKRRWEGLRLGNFEDG
jgi:hypothetical protein